MGNPKVGQHRFVVIGKQNICGFDVAMNDPEAVCGVKGACDFDAYPQDLLQRQGAVLTDASPKATTGAVGHDKEGAAPNGGSHLQDARDVRVACKSAHRPLFTQEPGLAVDVVEVCHEDLDRNRTIERRLRTAVNDAEATASDFSQIGEPADSRLNSNAASGGCCVAKGSLSAIDESSRV
ncbi:hypothetical protein AOT96_10700 [Rhodococcus sp. 008]|nr:hypothetical protein AOT96_10700 [Rhodococcus sp. 008]